MLATYSIKLQPRVVEKIDELVEANVCPSRNEFLREAAVKHLEDMDHIFLEKEIHRRIQEFKATAKKHPKSPFISREEKVRIADEFFKEGGIKKSHVEKLSASNR